MTILAAHRRKRRPAPQAASDYIENGTNGQDYFGSHTVSLKLGEPFTFNISASARTRYCEFTIDVTVQDRDKVLVVHVTDKGQKFKVTGLTGPYKALYVGGLKSIALGGPDAGKWRQVDPVTGK
ncbi:hypothetical protein AB0J72_39300 [Dactylosporangium sp. NPDC049742]|uniref:hypothetical protein n=1 Tax=Dactylosporangium sp. NPDC049742 TaxID=3154737 RepID=UPI003438DD71